MFIVSFAIDFCFSKMYNYNSYKSYNNLKEVLLMKKSYLSPKSFFVTVASADVITVSGVGEIFDWNDPAALPTGNVDEMK